ncbi:MAG: hypothetical protein V7735_09045, partial [Photobacterium frigidiphilum]|uniref:hypothetical protein n=1 Tax=Photobacterium frigidiphilum TaxID=264736 RepID=UPI0030026DAD
ATICYCSLFFGMYLSSKSISTESRFKIGTEKNSNLSRVIFFSSSIVSIVIASLVVLKMAGELNIFELLVKSIFNPGAMYYENMSKTAESSVLTQLITLTSPLTICLIAFSGTIIRNKSWLYKITLMFVVLLNVFTFLLRGTNFGVFLFIIVFIISVHMTFDGDKIKKKPIRYQTLIKNTFICLIGFLFVSYFVSTMASRLGSNYIPDTLFYIYVDKNSLLFDIFPPSIAVALLSAGMYFSQGYYGLSLSFNYMFTSTHGIGSGYFLLSKFNQYFRDDVFESTYQYKMDHLWDSRIQWHTAFTWLANDIGHLMVIPLMFIFGLFVSLVYQSAKNENSFLSIGLFSIQSVILIFLPANNIMGNNGFVFMSFTTLSFLWLINNKFTLK